MDSKYHPLRASSAVPFLFKEKGYKLTSGSQAEAGLRSVHPMLLLGHHGVSFPRMSFLRAVLCISPGVITAQSSLLFFALIQLELPAILGTRTIPLGFLSLLAFRIILHSL